MHHWCRLPDAGLIWSDGMTNMRKQIERLEARVPVADWGRPFLLGARHPVSRRARRCRLTLEDKPLLAIRLVGVHPGEKEPRPDPMHERDRHLLD
jgi:hypothetical protein